MGSNAGAKRPGVTLAEVLVALAILSGVLVSTAGLMDQGQRGLRAAAHASRALAAARSVIEELELIPYHRLRTFPECEAAAPVCRLVSGDASVAAWHAQAERDLPRPHVEVEIVALGAERIDAAPALRVTATLSWSEGGRRPRLRLATLRG